MIFWDQAVALFCDGFVKMAQKSDGKIVVCGNHKDMYLSLVDGEKLTKTVAEYVNDGYYKGWHLQMPIFLDEILVPIVLRGYIQSGFSFLDMYEELGLGVFHRHEENDRIWRRNCENYRQQVHEYANATK